MKGVYDGASGGSHYYPNSIPRDNSRYLESGIYYPTKDDFFESRLKEKDIKEDLRYSSPSDLIKGIKEEGVGCVAPKHLWSIYDKVKKLKEQEKNKIISLLKLKKEIEK